MKGNKAERGKVTKASANLNVNVDPNKKQTRTRAALHGHTMEPHAKPIGLSSLMCSTTQQANISACVP